MKNILAIFAILITIIIAGSGTILAQSGGMTASIPFDFTVGSEKLSAGQYTARILGDSVLMLQDIRGRSAASVMTVGVVSKGANLTHGELVFTRYGNQYFLHQAFWPGYDRGREALKSKRELEIARSSNRGKRVEISGNTGVAIDK